MSFTKSAGVSLIFLSLALFAFIFSPAVGEEVKYVIKKTPVVVEPVDKNFGIIIPKIGANARIITDVDPNDSKVYQEALTRGIAQAKGTKWFFFAHSAGNWLEANRYNAIFYLLSKLENNDEIWIYLNNKKLVYLVTDKKIVDGSDISYLKKDVDSTTITLMTCWPPGTTFKRLIILAKLAI